ncbi:BlaI/MecI/CopY family transcriptional regulator [Coraliomargarita sp. SDUM461003]|uniref:BlaI/MecI/CopY family transcriptional regulator n=1 Tax=Thalassobacterium maritimum TaxID=3041265 RepID=A0ABU1AUU0_9BACT|nr:BlaI/MecI/CopY family transcriptional regulator [Coraliomargarita sp. SDUM461003]MDQ8207861.1 BlaI/MecI/CopY family transcriptional regulator [Coraliomargarita sp. SDUM461003]
MSKKPSDFELQILGVLWESAPQTVREVRASLTDEKERAYTSVLSVMQVMEKKGYLRREKASSGNADLWSPAVDRAAVTSPLIRGWVQQLFGGRPSAVMQQLLDGDSVDASEVAEIRRLLKEYESNNDVS